MEVDVSTWLPAGSESVGTKPKRWLRDPESDIRWLMKDATHNTRADGTSSRKGDDWAERIATGVADRLDLPAARTEMAIRHGSERIRLGVISKEVLNPGEQLVLGNELLERPVGRRDRESYTLRAVHQALGDVAAPPDAGDELSAWDVFAGYLVLDALIGNTDRHEQNWAVILSATPRRLSPSFDHASSLGFQLEDAEKAARLSTNDRLYTPEHWAGRARAKFAGRPYLEGHTSWKRHSRPGGCSAASGRTIGSVDVKTWIGSSNRSGSCRSTGCPSQHESSLSASCGATGNDCWRTDAHDAYGAPAHSPTVALPPYGDRMRQHAQDVGPLGTNHHDRSRRMVAA